MLFSADSPLAALVVAPADAPVVVATATAEAGAPVARAVDATAPAEVRAGELVVVDAGVPRLDALLAGLAVPGGPEVVVLDGGAGDADEALARLGDLLAARANLGALHLVSHGGAGELELAGVPVTLVDLLAANATVTGWADAFADGADFLIYGCDVAAGQAGRAFVDTLALLTGTDVAASTDLTGATGAGGDWRLEYARGSVTADVVASPALRDGYDATLAIRTVSSFDDAGAGTLRQALLDANAGDEIRFSGPGTIRLRSELAEIDVPVTIDATTVAGYAGTPLVTLDGRDAGAYSDGLVLSAGSDGSTVRGLAIVNFSDEGLQLMDSGGHTVQSNFVGTDGANDAGNGDGGIHLLRSADNLIGGPARAQGNVVSANGGHGISIAGSASVRNVVGNNLIGTDADGEAALGNDRDGVAVLDGARRNAIGGAAELGNVISGNAGDGVAIADAGANTVAGNLIGLGADGVTALGNARHGVFLYGDADTNLVGTDGTVGARNVISANGHGIDGGDGVSIDGGTGTGATNNAIAGNLVGTDESGTLGRGNASDGVALYGEASGNTVGGAGALGNTIASSGGNGVRLSGAGATANAVVGNRIGTDVDGTGALDNVASGVLVAGGASDNEIGGHGDAGLGNLISGNGRDGVRLEGADTSGNSVAANRIGTDASGTSALPNDGDGVLIRAGAHDNLVGGPFVGHGNVISGNAFDGVEIQGAGTDRNTVAGNIIGLAEGTGAALGNGGHGVVVADGARDSRIGGDGVALFGNVISGNADSGVLIHGNHGTSGPTSGNLVTGNGIGTDVFGDVARPNGRHGVYIVAGASGNVVGGANAYLGNHVAGNAADGVHVSGATTADNRLENNVVGLDRDGASALPNAHDGVVVDGAPGTVIGGAAGLGNTISGNGNDGVEILNAGSDGALVAGNTIGLGTDGETAIGNGRHGVVLYRDVRDALIGTDGARGAPNTISGNGAAGVVIAGGGGNTRDNTVAGNLVGTDADGRLDRGNRFSGVSIFGGAHDNVVGGAGALRNVLSGNGIHGVHLYGAGTSTNVVAGNLIGTDVDGTADLGNGQDGVRIDVGASANTVGGDRDAGLGNLISGNDAYGIALVGTGTDDNRLLGNRIGTNADGDAALGNAQDGVFVLQGAAGTKIGSAAPGEGNLVSGNGDVGVEIIGEGSDDTVVRGNRIGTNAAGDAALGNARHGVILYGGAQGTRVGGAGAGEGNLISGNVGDGVHIDGLGGGTLRDSVVAGNLIGTDATGALALGNGGDGVVIANGATANTIGGVLAGAANTVSGNGGSGLHVVGAGTDANRIAGNRIGTSAAGDADLGNRLSGVAVGGGAVGTAIGGDRGTGAGNLISGNGQHGVHVRGGAGAETIGTVVEGNRIGTNAAGTERIANDVHGVSVAGGAAGTVIGGDRDDGRGNLVSGNALVGVTVAGAASTTVSGNLIGTDASGAAALGNGTDGVNVHGSATDTVVGGVDAGEANLVSGNGAEGVRIAGIGTARTTVAGNLIGTDVGGAADLGNAGNGVRVAVGAVDTQVGGPGAASGNTISGNGGSGVRIEGDGTLRATVAGNRIGTDASGGAALGNGGSGVRVGDGADEALIGGDRGAGLGNVISGNVGDGVEIVGADVQGVRVIGNRIGTDVDGLTALGNGAAGVHVDEAGAAVIGGAPGAGNLVSGNLASGIQVTDVASGGTTILGNVVGLDANGAKALGNGNDGIRIDDSVGTRIGNAGPNGGNTVSGNDDDGISVGGAASSNTIIAGNRIGTDPGGTAGLGNGGTGIRIEAGDRARIGGAADGEGNLVSGNASDGVRVDDADDVEIVNNLIGTTADGTAALPNGGAGVRVSGDAERTVVGGAGNGNLVSGNVERGIEIGGDEVLDTLVRANLVGTDADGAAALPNGGEGVLVHDGATGTRIGGDADAGQGNLVSGHAGAPGIAVSDATTSDTWIQGNRVGTTGNGDGALGNLAGVAVLDASGTVVGGDAQAGRGNLISGNVEDGVVVLGGASVGTQVLGNRIGTTADGLAANANGRHGIQVGGGARTVGIGGAGAAARNVVSGNGSDGVRIGVAADVTVLGNRVGTDAGGNAALGNGLNGIWVGGAVDAAIGGAGADEGNVIAGNVLAGVHLGAAASGATVAGNTVGLGADGATALGNGSHGIRVLAPGALVGGSGTGAGNTVSANGGVGVFVDAADGARLLGNTIGLDRAGALERGNGLSGVLIHDAEGVVVGETGAGNTVSGNGGVGVELERTNGSSVAGNRIGTSADGTIDVGNDRDGVRIFDDSADNLVGGADPASANTIRGNGGAGIAVLGAGSTGNALLLNVIVGNDGLGIDLGRTGTYPNDVLDADAGANDLANRPTLLRAGTDEAGRVEVDGRVETTANTDVRVDVYATGPEDGSGCGEAQRHLGSVTFRTDGDGVAGGRLTLSTTLARGEGVTATTTIVSSGGTPGSTSQFAENVVARELDVAPAITSGDFTVAENVTVAGTVTADDANGDALVYSVVGGADAALFTIDANAGTLRFESAPDAEAPADADGDGVYEVRVAVTDGWRTAERDVTVTVSDVDEADVGALSDANPAADELAEDAAIGSAVGIVASAEDADVDDSVTYALANDAGGLFAIDATSGVVTLAGALDAEKATSQDIVVRAVSTDGSSFERAFAITVADVDESDVGSVSDADPAAAVLAENAPVGSSAGITASAEDADVDDVVSYSLADNAGGRFAIDGSSGVVTIAGALDAETARSHEIVVRATSTDGSTSESAFAIAVTDVDETDVGPVDDTGPAASVLAEDALPGAPVGITASAADADIDDSVSYELVDDANGLFAIDSASGVVTLSGGLDAETSISHEIMVRATSTDGSISERAFAIAVTDVDESDVGPVNDADSAPAVLAEDAAPGSAAGITASVEDVDVDDSVAYELVDDANGLFAIDGTSGTVTLAGTLDAETATSHEIT